MNSDRTFPNLRALLTALRTERESQELTLEWIADKVGVSHVSVIGWESGQQRPTGERLRKWMRALQLPDELAEQYAALQTVEQVDRILAARGVDDESRNAVRLIIRGAYMGARGSPRRQPGAVAS